MCRGYLFGHCGNRLCKFRHSFMLCNRPQCMFNRCKMLHLTQIEFADLVANSRPFTKRAHCELGRLAYAYFSYLSMEQKDSLCSGKLVGGKCYRPTCLRCKERDLELASCPRCKCDLESARSYFFDCKHVICQRCLDEMPIVTEQCALPLHRCPTCYVFNYARKIYWTSKFFPCSPSSYPPANQPCFCRTNAFVVNSQLIFPRAFVVIPLCNEFAEPTPPT